MVSRFILTRGRFETAGKQLVSDMVSAISTSLNATIPVLLDSLNPLVVKSGAEIVGANIRGSSSSTPSQSAPLNAIPKQLSDPAYAEVLRISTYLTTLQAILNGKDTNREIDWAKAEGSESSGGSSLKFVSTKLADAKSRFASLATFEEPSQKLNTILNVCSQASCHFLAIVLTYTNGHRWHWSCKKLLLPIRQVLARSGQTRIQIKPESGSLSLVPNIAKLTHSLLQPGQFQELQLAELVHLSKLLRASAYYMT